MQHGRGPAAAIVLAGGAGSRFGAAANKVYLPLAGPPMITWSLAVLGAHPQVGAVVLVVRAQDREQAAAAVAAGSGAGAVLDVEVVEGGSTRQDSELAGLRRLAERIGAGLVDIVLIHDGARPLLGARLVDRVLRATAEVGGAVPGLPRHDLVAVGAGGVVADRAPAGLVAVQTPQGFRAAPLLAAYEAAAVAGFGGTDTASCVARFAPDLAVRRVDGDGSNIKITYPHDLELAAAVLAGARPADR